MRRAPPCSICGQPAPRGARLCAPCHAALKRAGQRTVQDLPHYRDPVPRRKSRTRAGADGDDAGQSGARRARRGAGEGARRGVLATAAIAALAGVAYLGQPQWRHDDDGAPGDARPPPGRDTAARSQDAAAALRPAAAVAVPAAPVSATPPVPDAPRSRAAPRLPGDAATPRPAPSPASRAEPAGELAAYPSLDAFGVVAEATRAPPPPAPVVRPAPPPDRWQRMSDALAQCEHEGGFAGFLCGQRTRIDACDGYWGRVPQCPDIPENPR